MFEVRLNRSTFKTIAIRGDQLYLVTVCTGNSCNNRVFLFEFFHQVKTYVGAPYFPFRQPKELVGATRETDLTFVSSAIWVHVLEISPTIWVDRIIITSF